MKMLTGEEIRRAFSIMGAFLRDRKTIGEIAVYGGGAIMFQFDWRASTQDIDAMVVSDGNHGLVRDAADKAAAELGLERSWLSEAVAQYTSKEKDASSLALAGMYPESGNPGLRVFVAKPEYMLAMKLAALQRATADERDFEDAKMLARALAVETIEELTQSYRAFFPNEEFPLRARLRLPELVAAIKSGL